MSDVTIGPRVRRFAVVQLLQTPFLLLAIAGSWPVALLVAALGGSAVCAGGTDSTSGPGGRLARWLNRILVLEAIVWITAAFVLGLPS
jgi:hypothetical protein